MTRKDKIAAIQDALSGADDFIYVPEMYSTYIDSVEYIFEREGKIFVCGKISFRGHALTVDEINGHDLNKILKAIGA